MKEIELKRLEKYIEQLRKEVGIEPSAMEEIADAIMTARIMIKIKTKEDETK
jgi:hypothetical protein